MAELGIVLPTPGNPPANFVPFVRAGGLVFISGQTPRVDGNVVYAGKVGRNVTVDDARSAARLCALHLIAHLKVACGGDLDRVLRCVRVTGYVNSEPDFTGQPQVLNGSSDLMTEIFGVRGQHASTAIGAAALPAGAAVEVEGIFEISAN